MHCFLRYRNRRTMHKASIILPVIKTKINPSTKILFFLTLTMRHPTRLCPDQRVPAMA